MDINWDDHSLPPQTDAQRISDDIYATWPDANDGKPLIWHWCTKSVWATKPDALPEYCQPSWAPAGGAAHDLIAREPLHLEPSLYWPGCCGMHGFIRGGGWIPA